MGKIKYSRQPDNSTKSCRASIPNLRVHFKNTHETAQAIKHMPFQRAVKYLQNVMEKKEIVPFRKFNHCVGRKAQAKVWNHTQAYKSSPCHIQVMVVEKGDFVSDPAGAASGRKKNLKRISGRTES